MKELMLTSGYNFDGYFIEKYLGICTGESALGTGIFSSINASVSDLFGLSSDAYEGKMTKAKELAFEMLQKNAKELGANAIIGVKIDYTTFSADIIGVYVSGTAVRVKKVNVPVQESIMKKEFVFPVTNYYQKIPFRINKLIYDQEMCNVKLNLVAYSSLEAINVDIVFKTLFGMEYIYKDINIIEIINGVETEKIFLNIPQNQLKAVKIVSVLINYYVIDGVCYKNQENNMESIMLIAELEKARNEFGDDIVAEYGKTDNIWTCVCGNTNVGGEVCDLCKRTYGKYDKVTVKVDALEIHKAMETMKNAKEIYSYFVEQGILKNSVYAVDLLKEVEELVKLERVYGNMKRDCIKVVEKYIKQ